jgi:adenosylcobinamide kinase / adenosylcobinamide-phosphate guanylyltransferase
LIIPLFDDYRRLGQRYFMEEREPRSITLVLGGVRSGKSRFAQRIAEQARSVEFIATAKAVDAEMEAKIRRHRKERPNSWQTVEEPLDLAPILATHGADFDLLLVDCLTIFVANALEDGVTSANEHIDSLVRALRTAEASVVLVSNEVGSGVVPDYPSGRQFRDLLGELNQRVAAVADNVVLMIAGLPLVLKGQIDSHCTTQPQSKKRVQVES